MNATRAREIRRNRHARRLAVMAYAEAGTQKAVGRARGCAPGTTGHWKTDRPDPAVFRPFVDLLRDPGTDALPMLEAQEQAYELHAVTETATDVLVRDGLALMEKEDEWDGKEDGALLLGMAEHAAALERYIRVARPLALTKRELAERRVDLHALYRQHKEGK